MARSLVNTAFYTLCKKFYRAKARTNNCLTNAEKLMLVWSKQCNSKILTASPHRIQEANITFKESDVQHGLWRNLAINQVTDEFKI
ncbi:PIPO [Stylosanthes mosaic-associated virus 2]|nr:PIPO [Stylosanthes mosaic-associated virus 2]